MLDKRQRSGSPYDEPCSVSAPSTANQSQQPRRRRSTKHEALQGVVPRKLARRRRRSSPVPVPDAQSSDSDDASILQQEQSQQQQQDDEQLQHQELEQEDEDGSSKCKKHLSEEERRARRRKANRESARRMRIKKSETITQLQQDLDSALERSKALQAENERLLRIMLGMGLQVSEAGTGGSGAPAAAAMALSEHAATLSADTGAPAVPGNADAMQLMSTALLPDSDKKPALISMPDQLPQQQEPPTAQAPALGAPLIRAPPIRAPSLEEGPGTPQASNAQPLHVASSVTAPSSTGCQDSGCADLGPGRSVTQGPAGTLAGALPAAAAPVPPLHAMPSTSHGAAPASADVNQQGMPPPQPHQQLSGQEPAGEAAAAGGGEPGGAPRSVLALNRLAQHGALAAAAFSFAVPWPEAPQGPQRTASLPPPHSGSHCRSTGGPPCSLTGPMSYAGSVAEVSTAGGGRCGSGAPAAGRRRRRGGAATSGANTSASSGGHGAEEWEGRPSKLARPAASWGAAPTNSASCGAAPSALTAGAASAVEHMRQADTPPEAQPPVQQPQPQLQPRPLLPQGLNTEAQAFDPHMQAALPLAPGWHPVQHQSSAAGAALGCSGARQGSLAQPEPPVHWQVQPQPQPPGGHMLDTARPTPQAREASAPAAAAYFDPACAGGILWPEAGSPGRDDLDLLLDECLGIAGAYGSHARLASPGSTPQLPEQDTLQAVLQAPPPAVAPAPVPAAAAQPRGFQRYNGGGGVAPQAPAMGLAALEQSDGLPSFVSGAVAPAASGASGGSGGSGCTLSGCSAPPNLPALQQRFAADRQHQRLQPQQQHLQQQSAFAGRHDAQQFLQMQSHSQVPPWCWPQAALDTGRCEWAVAASACAPADPMSLGVATMPQAAMMAPMAYPHQAFSMPMPSQLPLHQQQQMLAQMQSLPGWPHAQGWSPFGRPAAGALGQWQLGGHAPAGMAGLGAPSEFEHAAALAAAAAPSGPAASGATPDGLYEPRMHL